MEILGGIWNLTQTVPTQERKHRSALLIYSKLCLAPSNDHINSLKDYGDFAGESEQNDSSDSQQDATQPIIHK